MNSVVFTDNSQIIIDTNNTVHILERHVHSPRKIWPDLAAAVNLVAGAGAWIMGAITTIVPAGTITDDFDIHWINIEGASANTTYVIVLYEGALGSETEIGRTRWARLSPLTSSVNDQFQTEILAPNTRISGSVATQSVLAANIDISISYHTYPP